MQNQNGQFVLMTLAKIGAPATLAQITEKVASNIGGTATEELKNIVEVTLDAGVDAGLIEKLSNGSYNALISKPYVKYLKTGVGSK